MQKSGNNAFFKAMVLNFRSQKEHMHTTDGKKMHQLSCMA